MRALTLSEKTLEVMMKSLKSDKSFLVIDLGNSTLAAAVFHNEQVVFFNKYFSALSINYKDFKDLVFNLNEDLNKANIIIDEIVFSSVVKTKTPLCLKALKHYFKKDSNIITNNIKTPYVNLNTEEIGSDIYANLVEGRIKCPQKPCVVVDFGTAMTVSAVNDKGDVTGVVIYPGVQTKRESLFNKAPLLQKLYKKQIGKNPVEINQNTKADNTKKAIDIGMYYGTSGAVKSIVGFFENQINKDCYLLATGGDSGVFAPFIGAFDETDELHTLKGIYHIYKYAL